MVGNGIVAGTSGQHDDRVNYWTGAALGAIGVADQFLRPLEARYGADPIRGLPEATREQKLAKLRAAEDQLRRNAERAEERHQVLPYAGNAGLALAAGLVVGLWGEQGAGIQTGVSTLIGGALNILTEPGRPEQDWDELSRDDRPADRRRRRRRGAGDLRGRRQAQPSPALVSCACHAASDLIARTRRHRPWRRAPADGP